MENGNLAVPGSRLGFTRHAICAEQAAYGLLAHKLFGRPAPEITERKLARQLTGVQAFDFVEFITQRTENKFVSFSWKNKIGGMVVPIGPGHDSQPHFTVPIPNGLVGGFDLATPGDGKIKTTHHAWTQDTHGFETTGTLLRNSEQLKQDIKVTVIGESTLVYQDRVTALTNILVPAEYGVSLGIENDEITGGTRTVYFQGGEKRFDFEFHETGRVIPGSWANVDGRLGIVSVLGSGLGYVQARGYHPGIAVCADVLYGSFSDQPKSFKAGETAAHRVVVIFAEVSPEKTAILAKACRLIEKSGQQVLRCKLPEGRTVEIPVL
jgi:hypothetical protein